MLSTASHRLNADPSTLMSDQSKQIVPRLGYFPGIDLKEVQALAKEVCKVFISGWQRLH